MQMLPPAFAIGAPSVRRQPLAQGSGQRLAHHLKNLAGVQRARLLLDLR